MEKMVIWLTRKNKMLCNDGTEPLNMFRALVKSRLFWSINFTNWSMTLNLFSICGVLKMFHVNPVKRMVMMYCCKLDFILFSNMYA